jgi:serine/threonine protein kinase
VPGYEILTELGRGGMGVVYQARHLKLNRTVALKMILAGSHAGAADLARFQTEAEAIARLRHPNIVQVYEVGEHEGKPYFSLEFCGGGSLEKKLGGTPLPPAQAAPVVESLARAMEAAHQAGIVHRDLKPANILLSFGGRAEGGAGDSERPLNQAIPKITDFGLAKRLDVEGAGQTQSGAILGTPSYMAPEQAGGRKDIGPAADVYALGAILYECLTGRPPFRAATPLDTILQVISDEPVPPAQLNAKVPRDLQTMCLNCLQKEPGKRYASAEELAADLRRFKEGKPILARPVGPLERAVKWARRRPAAAALASVGVVAVLGLVGMLVSLGYSMELATAYQREQELRTDAEQSREDALDSRERLKAEKEKTEAALEAEQQARAREAVAQDQLE